MELGSQNESLNLMTATLMTHLSNACIPLTMHMGLLKISPFTQRLLPPNPIFKARAISSSIILPLFPFIVIFKVTMKLISLLGLLFFITPMFAAELPPDAITPNVCRGKRKKVEKCTGEPCTWEITRGVYDTMKTGML